MYSLSHKISLGTNFNSENVARRKILVTTAIDEEKTGKFVSIDGS